MVARKPPAKSAPLKLVLTRIFAAPRALVFAAWTQSKHMKSWSAPTGFTIPVSEGDLRVGGKWRACMVSPQGEKLWLQGSYREIVKDRKLVFSHAWVGEAGETVVTVRLTDHPRGTKMMFEQSGFGSTDSREGHKAGWVDCFVRLKNHLAVSSGRKTRPHLSAAV
jgi:uncharacterized protein YndB with AHSA1/START domain